MAMETEMQGEEREEQSDIGLRLGRKVPFSQDYSKEIHIAQEIVAILQERFAAIPNLDFCKIMEFVEIMR